MKWNDSNRNTALRMGDIDMALKVIATAADALVILGLMREQVKQKDNSNAMGYLLSYAIFAMNIMVIWK
jgi:hypothetical protein|nr:MAG TPA: hypothetical protein [Caudoviricetes sp.]